MYVYAHVHIENVHKQHEQLKKKYIKHKFYPFQISSFKFYLKYFVVLYCELLSFWYWTIFSMFQQNTTALKLLNVSF